MNSIVMAITIHYSNLLIRCSCLKFKKKLVLTVRPIWVYTQETHDQSLKCGEELQNQCLF